MYSGHVMHFEWEDESNLGRNLVERPFSLPISDARLAWNDN